MSQNLQIIRGPEGPCNQKQALCRHHCRGTFWETTISQFCCFKKVKKILNFWTVSTICIWADIIAEVPFEKKHLANSGYLNVLNFSTFSTICFWADIIAEVLFEKQQLANSGYLKRLKRFELLNILHYLYLGRWKSSPNAPKIALSWPKLWSELLRNPVSHPRSPRIRVILRGIPMLCRRLAIRVLRKRSCPAFWVQRPLRLNNLCVVRGLHRQNHSIASQQGRLEATYHFLSTGINVKI